MWKIEKTNAFIQKELGNIILKELDIFPGILLTITRAECSPNFIEVKVFVSVLPEDKTEEVFSFSREIFLIFSKCLIKNESKTSAEDKICQRNANRSSCKNRESFKRHWKK